MDDNEGTGRRDPFAQVRARIDAVRRSLPRGRPPTVERDRQNGRVVVDTVDDLPAAQTDAVDWLLPDLTLIGPAAGDDLAVRVFGLTPVPEWPRGVGA